ncbi:serine protein kinase RIO [Nocardioides sp. SYSU DS0663]|uniref:serine protein kinase RIO n=1 Tax=Nocardioides sp. SYSU DS0663 TaxID=3416445 RepID=UPI003F4BF4BA
MSQHDPHHPSTTPDPTRASLDASILRDWHTYDDLADGQRWTTWYDVEPLCRGPEPRPGWVVTSRGAVDTDLGVLKTGKEADVHLLERADPKAPAGGVVMAAKRYRTTEHRTFHRAAGYTEGRSTKRSRDERAVKRKSTFGRQVAAGEWAASEWEALKRLWRAGLPVPYPVQLDGTELLMEWICVEGEDGPETAPRLAQTRPARPLLESWFEQVREALATLVEHGLVHGDLSPYNVLAAGEQLVVIDLPQVVDLVGNLNGMDYLLRDCTTMCAWFRARGLEVDEQGLFAELLAHAF